MSIKPLAAPPDPNPCATSIWTAAHIADIAAAPLPALPVIDPAQVQRFPGLDLWDFWPVTDRAGPIAAIAGGELWFSLSAPAEGDPLLRHGRARLHLLHRAGGRWIDLGATLPSGLSPGSREWSGSAVLDAERQVVTLYFTAAGRSGEARRTFAQRLFETRGRLRSDGRITGWSDPIESVASDGIDYLVVDQVEGSIGTIKAFRDPGWFRDPATGTGWLLFAASLARSTSAFNGAVGIAEQTGEGWRLRPPLVHADGLNNELERPHIVVQDGYYYLFWSTQASVFAPGNAAPTGLYGMVAERLSGPYAPLNGTGLVAANPPAAPLQAYSWLVLDDLRVTSFVDQIGPGRAGFGGVPAPEFQLRLEGSGAWIA